MCVRTALEGSLKNTVGEICGNEDCKIREEYLSAPDRRSNKLKKPKYWRIFTTTTQPSHLVMVFVVAIVSSVLMPDHYPPLNLLYLGSVSSHFGIQIWMSFVSGLSLYFTLPRRLFGTVQRILFPTYFLVNSILSWISLCIFLKNHTGRLLLPQIRLQVEALVLCFSLELVIRIFLTPPLLYFMSKAAKYEEEAGVGMEVGKHQSGVLEHNTDYLLVYTSFRKLHMAIAIGNVITLGCSMVHIHYLASVIQFT